jgi:hypothetical protein
MFDVLPLISGRQVMDGKSGRARGVGGGGLKGFDTPFRFCYILPPLMMAEKPPGPWRMCFMTFFFLLRLFHDGSISGWSGGSILNTGRIIYPFYFDLFNSSLLNVEQISAAGS